MNAELLYTSAPQGLKQGSRGFCTVLSTVGMPLNIATKLESLSGYRHLHPSGTPDAAKNPVNHSHLKLTVGGRTLSVISRISDYGLDYSQRTNKLAHHVVVDSPMPTCGPAALLGDPSVIRSEWDGNCVNIPTPPAFPALSVEPAVCRAWESIAGDAGWAGVVANAWLNNASKPIFLIFSEDQSPEILPLIAEAIAILPHSKRWQATFGTYVTNLPPDVDCKVRCVVAGSDEARMASARGVVIDLTQPCGPAPSSEAATAARNGTFVGARSNVPPLHGSLDVDEEQPPAIGDTIEDSEPTDFDPERPFGTQSAGPPPTIRPGTGRIVHQRKTKNPSPKPSTTLARITAIAIGLIFCSLIGLVYYLSQNPWLKGLNIVATETEAKQSTVEQPTPEVPEAPDQEEKSNPTVAGKPNPAPMPSQQPSEPPKSLLKPDEIVIRLANPKRKLDTPVAIRGESIEATFDSTKPSLTEEEKAFLGELREKSQRSWFAIRKKSGEPRNLGSNSNLEVPADTAEEQVFLEVKYNGETWTSDRISIIDQAKETDFKLSLTDFTINSKNIPFGLPGSTVSAKVELANTREDYQEYLSSLVSTAKLSWHSKSTETPLSGEKEYRIPEKTSLSDIFAVARIGDGSLSLQSESRPVIGRLFGEMEIDSNDPNGSRIGIRIRDPFENSKRYQFRLGKQRLKDPFLVNQLVPEDETSDAYQKTKNISIDLAKSVQYCNQLKAEFVPLIKILKESKALEINRGIVDEFKAFGDFSFFSIGEAISNKQLDELHKALQRMTLLISIAPFPEADRNKKIKERCMPKDSKNQDEVVLAKKREEDELFFITWYTNSIENKIAKQTVTNDGFKLLQIMNQVYQSMQNLLVPINLVIDNPKLELFVGSKNDTEDSIDKISQVKIPIELNWRFPTRNRKSDLQDGNSENYETGPDNEGRELEAETAPGAKQKKF